MAVLSLPRRHRRARPIPRVVHAHGPSTTTSHQRPLCVYTHLQRTPARGPSRIFAGRACQRPRVHFPLTQFTTPVRFCFPAASFARRASCATPPRAGGALKHVRSQFAAPPWSRRAAAAGKNKKRVTGEGAALPRVIPIGHRSNRVTRQMRGGAWTITSARVIVHLFPNKGGSALIHPEPATFVMLAFLFYPLHRKIPPNRIRSARMFQPRRLALADSSARLFFFSASLPSGYTSSEKKILGKLRTSFHAVRNGSKKEEKRSTATFLALSPLFFS